MSQCLLCNGRLNWRPTFKELFSFVRLQPPLICRHCQGQFDRWPAGGCTMCGRPKQGENLCDECQAWQNKLGWLVPVEACYQYQDAMRDYMYRYKFQGDYRLRFAFRAELTRRAKALGDCLVAIPVSAQTMATRGFNQVTGLLEVETVPALAVKAQAKNRQSAKSRQERLATPQPFELVDPSLVAGKRVVLIDDVLTTGRTFYHAATLLKEAGCKELRGLVLASA